MNRCVPAALALALIATIASADDKQPSLDKIKKLVGEWVALDEKGKPTDQVVSSFRIIAGGSAVQETIFPGKGEEMVSIYHMDGKDLLMTHYCSLGNQPKMKLDPKGKDNQLKFDFAGGTNFDPAKDMHMHEGLITILDDNHIEWSWAGYDGGKPADGHKVSMKLERKKK